ncbi:efflux RND transporter periplasmic adaptor subunit [Trichocoleus sp. FACHB-591]|uniref:efflux RND transporter periplasmic adaptor subunit n=1 Tax=Trichocoleus sp. FACHB-591 TaxID=2692872 RepID=UPI001684C1D5|nr:efflux RND transporter periplasmic adaptor subunit [Trichocoleus sp. FACHB-591]MBD2097404.1 efflux RND transporter periplasmic adaptor subunit [Trichocoleus sp. FACHB-591]
MSGNDTQQQPALPAISEGELNAPQHPQEPSQPPNSSRFRRWLLPVTIGLLLLGGIGWIIFSRFIMPMLMAGSMQPPPTPVQLGTPESAPVEDSSDYAATLDSRQSVTLQPRVSGQVSAIYVEAGDRVEAGEPLLQIGAAEQRAQVASRNAAVDTAAADIDSAQADVASAIDTLKALQEKRAADQANVQLNQREYERYQELQRQGAESRQILDQRLNALQTAQATVRQTEADIRAQQSAINRAKSQVVRSQRALEQAQANVAEGQAQLQDYAITAPFAGVIGNIPVKQGDVVSAATPLLTLTQNQELEVQIAIPLERAPNLRLGLPVKLLSDQDRVLQTGKVSFISPSVDPSTQSVQVKALFDNANNQLRTSQFVRARVIWQSRSGVLAPTTAISRLGGRDFIFVAAPFQSSGCQAQAQANAAPAGAPGGPQVEPDQLVAVQKPIKLGRIVGNNQEVVEGLSASDRIVTSGILQLQNCMPIAADTPPANAPASAP